MDTVFKTLPLLTPILLLDLALAATAVVHIIRHPHYRFGNRMTWLVISIILLLFGPVIYFVFGKGQEE